MGIILVLLAVAAGGIVLLCVTSSNHSYDCGLHDIGSIVTVCGIIFLLVAGLVLIGTRTSIRSEMLGLEQTRITIENARSNEGISKYEIAALQQKIVDYNAWLAITKYWQRNLWVNWFIPAWVQELELLK